VVGGGAEVSATRYAVKDKVTIHGIGAGWIARAWKDDAGEDLYLVLMEDAGATPTGEYLARNCELVAVRQ
jgi:hypothetical protein